MGRRGGGRALGSYFRGLHLVSTDKYGSTIRRGMSCFTSLLGSQIRERRPRRCVRIVRRASLLFLLPPFTAMGAERGKIAESFP